MAHKRKPRSEAELHSEIGVAIQELVRKGLLVDSGRKRWSKRSQCYHGLGCGEVPAKAALNPG